MLPPIEQRNERQLDSSLLPQSGGERCVRSPPAVAAARCIPPERRRWFIKASIGHFDLSAAKKVSLVVLLDQMKHPGPWDAASIRSQPALWAH